MNKLILVTLFFVFSCSHAENSANQCSEGQMREGYLEHFPVAHNGCTKQVQTCLNNKWSGPQLYPHCESNLKPCDGLPHGYVENGFTSMASSPGLPCIQATRTCNNGTWSGPALFPNCQ